MALLPLYDHVSRLPACTRRQHYYLRSSNRDYTYVYSINSHGAITGYYTAAAVSHGFVRDSDGTITTFDPPASTGTVASAINDAGAIAGYYLDSSYALQGFVRAPGGTFATFTVIEGQNTQPIAINSSGEVTGTTYDSTGNIVADFVRDVDGSITTFFPTEGSNISVPFARLSATTPTRKAFRTDSCVGPTVPSPPLKPPAQPAFSRRASTRVGRSSATIRPTATAAPTASC